MFSRSRPWRARGPSLGACVGSRRRGRRTEILATALLTPDPVPSAESDVDTLPMAAVAAASAIESPSSVTENLPAARIDESGLLAVARRAHDLAQVKSADLAAPLDRLSPSSLVQWLSQRSDDANHHSRSRRSA